MRYIAWIVGLVVLDIVIFVLWMFATLPENCGHGNSGWECGDLLQETLKPVLPYSFVAAVALTVVVVLIALGHAIKVGFRSRHSGGQ